MKTIHIIGLHMGILAIMACLVVIAAQRNMPATPSFVVSTSTIAPEVCEGAGRVTHAVRTGDAIKVTCSGPLTRTIRA
jgi:hypothetical protein